MATNESHRPRHGPSSPRMNRPTRIFSKQNSENVTAENSAEDVSER